MLVLLAFHSGFLIISIISVSWLYTVRCAFISAKFLKTIDAQLIYDEEGVSIENSKGSKYFKWNELTKYKEYNDMDVLALMDSQGKNIMMLWSYAPKFKNFVEQWTRQSGIDT